MSDFGGNFICPIGHYQTSNTRLHEAPDVSPLFVMQISYSSIHCISCHRHSKIEPSPSTNARLSPFHKQNVNCRIPEHQKHTADNRKTNSVLP